MLIFVIDAQKKMKLGFTDCKTSLFSIKLFLLIFDVTIKN